MNQGNFDEYQIEQSAIEKQDSEDSTQNMEVYQMLEEYMNIIQTEYKGEDSDDTQTTAIEPRGDKSPKRATPDRGQDIDSDDESSDNDIDRNANASPLIKQSNKWANQNKYKPRMTDIVEETEPESSFKETNKHKKKKAIKGKVIPIREEEDRDDDFSDESDDLTVK